MSEIIYKSLQGLHMSKIYFKVTFHFYYMCGGVILLHCFLLEKVDERGI
jgi:hypothetical protein